MPDGELSKLQRRAAELYGQGRKTGQIAAQLRIDRTTLWTWTKLPGFREVSEATAQRISESLHRRTMAAATAGVDKLEAIVAAARLPVAQDEHDAEEDGEDEPEGEDYRPGHVGTPSWSEVISASRTLVYAGIRARQMDVRAGDDGKRPDEVAREIREQLASMNAMFGDPTEEPEGEP